MTGPQGFRFVAFVGVSRWCATAWIVGTSSRVSFVRTHSRRGLNEAFDLGFFVGFWR